MRFFKMSLTMQMAIATLLGILFGLFFGEICAVFEPWASAYIMLLKITAIPYLAFAIVHGVGQLSISQAKEILKKGILFIGIAWVINIIAIYSIVFLFPRVKGFKYASYSLTPPPTLNFAELIIPQNIFYALANNVIPAVVVFSLCIGIALMHLKEKAPTMSVLQTIVEALTRITAWIARITPIGTFLIIANQIGTIHPTTIKQVSTYIILYILGVSIVIFWVFPRLTSMLTSIKAIKWLKDLLPILVLAYTTNLVIVCLPYIIQLIQKVTQSFYTTEERLESQIQGTVSIVYNLPLGSLFITVFIFFISIFYNLPLSVKNQGELFLTTFLTSLGAVGIGSWINSLTFLLDTLAIPLDAINLYLVTLPFTSGFQSMASAIEISTLSLLITLACRQVVQFKWTKIVKSCVITSLPILILILGLKALNPFPQIQNQNKSIYDISIEIPVKTLTSNEKNHVTYDESNDTFDRILKSKILRVGCNPHVPPFCFYNHKGQIVGYDIAFAYALAHDLDCMLELVLMDYANLASDINSNRYDIAMSAVSITEERLKNLNFTRSYLQPKIIFITHPDKRKYFKSKNEILNANITIAALRGSSYEDLAHKLFPTKELILLDNYESFAETTEADGLLWEEQEGIAWIISHPTFKLVNSVPIIGTDALGYPIKANSARFLEYLDQWLKLKQTEGFSEKQYNLWVLGKTAAETSNVHPRWSIFGEIFKKKDSSNANNEGKCDKKITPKY